MLIEKKGGRSCREDRQLAVALAGSAGILNVLALGAFGLFPSNMTGNATQLSTEVLEWDKSQMWRLIQLIICFIAGAFTSRALVAAGKFFQIRTVYAHILLAEGVILTVPVVISLWLPFSPDQRLLVDGLGFLLGLHNATSTQLTQGKVRSTHITGTLTDAGISMANLLLQPLIKHSEEERRRYRYLLSIHLTAICSFFTGGLIGIFSFHLFSMLAFSLSGILLILVASVSIFRAVRYQHRFSLSARTAV